MINRSRNFFFFFFSRSVLLTCTQTLVISWLNQQFYGALFMVFWICILNRKHFINVTLRTESLVNHEIWITMWQITNTNICVVGQCPFSSGTHKFTLLLPHNMKILLPRRTLQFLIWNIFCWLRLLIIFFFHLLLFLKVRILPWIQFRNSPTQKVTC